MARDGLGTARRAVTAFFDDRAAAQQAVDDLVAAKVDRDRITLVEGGPAPVATEPVPTHDKGIWATVKDLFMADEDRHAYGEGLRRGGFLLSVMLGGSDAARVVEILDREGAVDMDARQSDWEMEGWDPTRASADLGALSRVSWLDSRNPAQLGGETKQDRVGGPTRSCSGEPAHAAASMLEPSPDTLRDAMEPAAAVGPAFGTGEAPRPAGRSVKRDAEADGLRLRTYVESHDHPDAMP